MDYSSDYLAASADTRTECLRESVTTIAACGKHTFFGSLLPPRICLPPEVRPPPTKNLSNIVSV